LKSLKKNLPARTHDGKENAWGRAKQGRNQVTNQVGAQKKPKVTSELRLSK
jgi:hypothetical protein